MSEARHAAAEPRRKAPRRLCWGLLGRFTGAASGLVCVWTLSRTVVKAFKDYKSAGLETQRDPALHGSYSRLKEDDDKEGKKKLSPVL